MSHIPSAPLRRSRIDRVIAGVCGGRARHFGLDPTLVRVAYVILSIVLAAFPGTLVYLFMWMFVPEDEG